MIERHATIAGLGTTIRFAIALLLKAAEQLILPIGRVPLPHGLNLPPPPHPRRAERARTWLETLAALLAGSYKLTPPRPPSLPRLPAVAGTATGRPSRPQPERAMRHAFRYQQTGELVVSLTRDLGLHPGAQQIPAVLFGIPETPYELSLLVNPDEPPEILFPDYDFTNPIPVERPKPPTPEPTLEPAPEPTLEPAAPDTG